VIHKLKKLKWLDYKRIKKQVRALASLMEALLISDATLRSSDGGIF
jgi:hypothetical protein